MLHQERPQEIDRQEHKLLQLKQLVFSKWSVPLEIFAIA